MIDSALEILYVYILGIINQQAIGYAADVVCMYVCMHLLYMWVGQVDMCVARGSQLAACFILFFFIFIDSNIPHKRLSALNFSVRDIRFTREKKKHQLGDVAKLWCTNKPKKIYYVCMSVGR